MHDLIGLVDRVRIRSAELNDELASRYSLATDALPISGLNMSNQHAVIALELLTHYYEIWRRLAPELFTDPDRVRQENAERVVELTKAAFILSLSSFEFAAKHTVLANHKSLTRLNGRIYLKRIIKESASSNMIPQYDEHPWEGVIELRNTLVHNNGIAEKTAVFAVPYTPGISFLKDTMTQGNLKFFPQIHLWIVEAFARWCDGYLKEP